MYACLNARALGLTLPASEAIDLAAGAGFGGVDLMVRDLLDDGDDPRELRHRIEDRGLRGGAFPLPVHWRGDESEFARDLARLPRLAEAAATLGLFRTGTWVWPEIPADFAPDEPSPDRRRERALAFHAGRLGAIARVLDGFGIRLGLEVLGVPSSRSGAGEPFVTRLADLGPLLDAAREVGPDLGVLVDGFHLFAADEPHEAAWRWGVERIAWVHIADLPAGASTERRLMRDSDRGLPGEHPASDTIGLLRSLADAGYEGPVTPEPLSGCGSLARLGVPERLGRVAAAVRAVWPEARPSGR